MAATPAPARWVIPAGASIALAAALTVTSALRAPEISVWLAISGGVAVLLAGGAIVWRRPSGITGAVILVGAEYAAALLRSGAGPDPTAPIVGVALLLIAEFGLTACEWREPHLLLAGVEARRWFTIAATAAGGVAVGTLALEFAQSTATLGVIELAAGAVAAVAMVGLVTRLTRDARLRG
jgi:hypothetical protein